MENYTLISNDADLLLSKRCTTMHLYNTVIASMTGIEKNGLQRLLDGCLGGDRDALNEFENGVF